MEPSEEIGPVKRNLKVTEKMKLHKQAEEEKKKKLSRRIPKTKRKVKINTIDRNINNQKGIRIYDEAGLSELELRRQHNIIKNHEFMKSCGLTDEPLVYVRGNPWAAEYSDSGEEEDATKYEKKYPGLSFQPLVIIERCSKENLKNQITSLQAELTQQITTVTNNAANDEQVTKLQKELEKSNKTLTTKASEIIGKSRLIQQNQINSLRAELTHQTTAVTNNAANDEQVTNFQKELEESKKTLTTKSTEIIEKTCLIQQLKNVAKKYRTQVEKQQNVLNDNNLSAEGETIAPPTDGSAASTESANKPDSSQEKEAWQQQLESKLKDQTVEINKLTKQISELQGRIAVEKIASKKSQSIRDNKEKYKEVENLTKEGADSKKKLEELQDRIQSLTRTKASNSREYQQLKTIVEDLQRKLQASNTASDQASQLIAEKSQLESRVVTLENQMNIKLQELVNQNNNLQEEKRKADETINKQKKTFKLKQ